MKADRFLGLTKFQFAVVLVALMFVVFVAQAYTIREVGDQAAEGRQAHVAFCSYKHDLAQRAASSAEFLRLTHKERVAKYGRALGSIPDATIRQSYRQQQAALASLAALHCD